MKFKQAFPLLKMSFKLPLKNKCNKIKNKEKILWLDSDGIKTLLAVNLLEKPNRERNPTSENISYLVDLKICVIMENFIH